MRISDWSSDVCSSDLGEPDFGGAARHRGRIQRRQQHAHRERMRRRVGGGENDDFAGFDRTPVMKLHDAPRVGSQLLGHRLRKRSEEHTSELQSLMRISYAVFCLKKKKTPTYTHISTSHLPTYTTPHNKQSQ